MTPAAKDKIISLNLWDKFLELFFVGGAYSNVYSKAIFCSALVVCMCKALCCKKRCEGKLIKIDEKSSAVWNGVCKVQVLLVIVLFLTVCAVLWNSQAVVTLRKSIGGMVTYFQADRVYWTFPFLWMLILAYVLQVMLEFSKARKRLMRGGLLGICILLFAVEGYQVFQDSNFNKNIRLLLLEGYEQVTWESLYMEDVFEQIDTAIDTEKTSYSVVSLGIYPSVALYNGYTCADGYSNNYDLAYKHEFRKIQVAELIKEPEVQRYFDDWGNRLYLVSSTYGVNSMVGKTQQIKYHDLDYDTDAMKKLNIKYIFAAAPVIDASEMGWILVNGSPFSSESSFYEVWVYEIK